MEACNIDCVKVIIRIGGKMSSFVCTGFAFGSFLVFFVNSYILPVIGYKNMLQIVALIGAAEYILLFLLDIQPKWENKSIEGTELHSPLANS